METKSEKFLKTIYFIFKALITIYVSNIKKEEEK